MLLSGRWNIMKLNPVVFNGSLVDLQAILLDEDDWEPLSRGRNVS